MPFPMQRQEMGLWCWAAVAASTDKYFDPRSRSTQCSIATAVKHRACCPKNEVCNEADILDAALAAVGRLARAGEGILTFEQIRDELELGFPIGARIGWFRGGGHFVLITGFRVSDSGAGVVTIADPLYPGNQWLYDDFVNAYRSLGGWTHTYLLRP